MTPRQQSVLRFIEDYTDRKGISPTYDEIAAGLGLSSRSAPFRAVAGLQAQGIVSVTSSGSRGITVLRGRDKALAEIIGAALARFGDQAVRAELDRWTGRVA